MSFKTRALALAFAAVAAFTTPARAADPVTLRIGYIPILAAAPLFVLTGEGWATQEGLDVKLTRFVDGPAAIQALAAGQVEMIYAGVAPVIVARSKGVDVSVIANSGIEELVLVARGPLAKLAKDKPAAEAVKELAATAGRKVKFGTQPAGSVPDTVLRHWLFKVAKLDPAIVEIVPMGIEKTQQALMAGALDAADIREPTITIVKNTDPAAAILALGGEMFPGQPGTVVAARGEVLRQHTDAVGRFVAIHKRAVDVVTKDPKRAAALSNEHLGKGLVEPAVLEAALTSPASKFTADPHTIVEAVKRMQAFQQETGSAQGNSAAVEEAFDFRFYDAAK
ncbi:ABC transporter substrate-binding protein [Azospirillum sp. sgz301742]